MSAVAAAAGAESSSLDAALAEVVSLAREARWLRAWGALQAYEATLAEGKKEETVKGEWFEEVRLRGAAFEGCRARCDDRAGWEPGVSYGGVESSFRRTADGELWLRTEGPLRDIDLFCTIAVLREVELYDEWVPFVRDPRVLRHVDLSRLVACFRVGVPLVFQRDCVLRVAACAHLEDSALYFEGASPEDGAETCSGTPVPPRTRGFAFDRLQVHAFNASIHFTSPESQHCVIVANVDLRAHVPRALLDFFMKKLVGLFLILARRCARNVARDPASKHRIAMRGDPGFYLDFLWPRYLAFAQTQGWPRPTHVDDETTEAPSLATPPPTDSDGFLADRPHGAALAN